MHVWYARRMTERVTITLPDGLVAELDAIAERQGLSRSGVIREASARYVAGVDAEETAARRRAGGDDLIAFLEELRRSHPLDGRPVLDILREVREGTPEDAG